MTEMIVKDKEYYELVLNALAGIEDDMAASRVPTEAIDKINEALLICRKDFKCRFTQ